MPKRKAKLDRKTRRAIEHMVRQQVGAASKANKATTTFSLNTKGHLAGLGSSLAGWATKASSGGSSKAARATVELPAITAALHPSRFFIDDISFHMDVAEAMIPGFDYTLVCRSTKQEHEVSFEQLAFYTEEARTEFETWMNKYLEKFGKHADLVLPPPVDGVYPHTVRSNFERRAATASNNSPLGSLAKASSSASSSDTHDQERLEQWLWILENCTGEVRHAGSFWFFADGGDATLFKMAYS